MIDGDEKMKNRNKIILIAIISVVSIASIVIGPVIFMIGANGYSGFIISSISNEEFEKDFAKIPEVKFFIEKYPTYTTSHLSDFLGWKIIYYDPNIDDEKSIHLSVKKSVLHGKVKIIAGCDDSSDTIAFDIIGENVMDYLKNDQCLGEKNEK